MIASIMQESGYKVVLYTSPHLKDFRERIRINGQPIKDVKIEKFTKLHSNVHIGQHSLVMCFSYLFPYTILTNDPIPPSNLRMGVTIEPFAVICTRSTILPGKKIGFGSFVGANSLVNKDLNSETIGSGNPFKQRGNISLLKNSFKNFI